METVHTESVDLFCVSKFAKCVLKLTKKGANGGLLLKKTLHCGRNFTIFNAIISSTTGKLD